MNEMVQHRLNRPVDGRRDHVRGGTPQDADTTVVIYNDYLCPYCRRLKVITDRLREDLGNRVAFVYRHFPNERSHPGARKIAAAVEASGKPTFFVGEEMFFGKERLGQVEAELARSPTS